MSRVHDALRRAEQAAQLRSANLKVAQLDPAKQLSDVTKEILPGGADVTCVQVAGLIARRILCYVKGGDQLARGQRFGFIRFGSRVDVYLPPSAVPKVSVGDKVYAASTVLAQLN